MESQLMGYFYKKIKRDASAGRSPIVKEICSASSCSFTEPDGWIEHWKHNDYFLYNTPEIARSVIQILSDKNEYDLYAYKQFPIRIEKGKIVEEKILCEMPEPLSEEFSFLGYDAVSRCMTESFGCSPLSCNYGAEKMSTNEYCLFSSYEEALSGAKEFSSGSWESGPYYSGSWEPGPYYVVEVYRAERN